MKFGTVIFSILQLLLLSEITQSQEQPERQKPNRISISAGSSSLARQDLIYSPFIHSDYSFMSLGIKYQYDNELLHNLEANFSANQSQTNNSEDIQMGDHNHGFIPHEFLFMNLTYGLGKAIRNSPSIEEWIGGSIKGDLQAAFYNFQLSEMFGYYIEFSLNAWYRYKYNLSDRQLLSIQAELPLVAWLARPPYLAEDDGFIENISSHNKFKTLLAFIGDGKLVTVNKLQRINLNLEYVYTISGRFSVGAEYRFTFIHSGDPKTLLSYQNNLNLTTSINF